MKGALTRFKSQVEKTINKAYEPYINDIIGVIGYLPQARGETNKRLRPHQKDLTANLEEER